MDRCPIAPKGQKEEVELLDNSAKIIYTGETDVVFSQGYLSMTLRSDWFFSKDKKCYGIPISFKCTDTIGDAFFTISLHDTNNNLHVGLSLDFCTTYNAVVWVDRNLSGRIVEITTSVDFCGKRFPSELIIADFCSANLSETVNADQNKDREQGCFNDLDFIELWKLRKKSLCLDGIVLDNVLKYKLRLTGYVVNRFEHRSIDPTCMDLHFENEDLIYYVWCGLHVGSQSEIFHYTPPEQTGNDDELNGLKISAVFSHHVTPDGNSVLSDQLCVFATDKEHSNSGLNGISRVPYDLFMDEVVWNNTLTNLLIRYDPDEVNGVLEQQFIDIPVKYHDRRILLRLMLNPNWNILFIVIQNKLQDG